MSGIPACYRVLDSLPPFSDNARRLLYASTALADLLGSSKICTEHLLLALVTPVRGCQPRISTWMLKQMSADSKDSKRSQRSQVSNMHSAFVRELKCRDVSTSLSAPTEQQLDALPSTLSQRVSNGGLSSGLLRVLEVLNDICKEPVSDGDYVYETGLVASEFLMAALLVEGTSKASHLVERVTRGKVNSFNILTAIGVDPHSIHSPRTPDQKWESFEIKVSGDGKAEEKTSISLPVSLPEFSSLPEPPTYHSNYLFPSLITGESVGGGYGNDDQVTLGELNALVAAGVTTFLCLRGEFRSLSKYRTTYYPKLLSRVRAASPRDVECVYFPIRDFNVCSQSELMALILELKRRMSSGEVIYVHCQGGHGRTGTVVIPLVAYLCDVDFETAQHYVETCVSEGRPSDRGYECELPETRQQANLVEQVIQELGATKNVRRR